MIKPELPTAQIIEQVETVWGAPYHPAACPACSQAYLINPGVRDPVCPNCAREALSPQPARLRAEPPEAGVSFAVSPENARAILSRYVSEVWLRPADLDAARLQQRMVPVFWPLWIVDSDVAGSWKAEIGYEYQVKSSQEAYTNGGWRSRDVIETRTRWEPRLGSISRHFDNIPAPASSLHEKVTALVGDYELGQAVPYPQLEPRQAFFQIPDLHPEMAWPVAQARLDRAAADECRQAAQGQHLRSFELRAEYRSLHWTQLLLPLYATYYTDDDGQRFPIVINGQSGKIGGQRRASQRKGWLYAGILAAAALVALLLGLLGIALSPVLPPLSIAGILLLILAFGLGIAALIPALWPWRWNRSRQDQQ